MESLKITQYLKMLEDEGWTYAQSGNSPQLIWWKAYYKTIYRRISIYIGQSQECLILELPYGIQPTGPCYTALSRYLLRLNHELKLGRFSLDTYNYIYLAADMEVSSVTFTTFKQVLTALRMYFEQYSREIELMAKNPGLAQAWMSLWPKGSDLDIEIYGEEMIR